MPLISSAARYFDEVARLGSIRSAAARLNVSPSAVSRQILNLETEYGMPLFERLPRGVRLTAAGEVLLNRVRRWRQDQEKERRQLQEMQGLRRGHVTVGLMECLAADFVPRVFAGIQHKFRGITLDAIVGGTEQIAKDVSAGEIDIAIAFNMPARREIKEVWSIKEAIGAVMSTTHPLAARSTLKLSDCAQFPLVLPGWSLSIRPMIDSALSTAGIDPVSSITSNSIELIKAAVRWGPGIAFLTRIDVYRELAAGELAFRPLDDYRMEPEILSLCVQTTRSVSPILALVADTSKAALAEMAEGIDTTRAPLP